MKPYEIAFSHNRFDHWRLSQVGGSISVDKKGKPTFRFRDRKHYNEYLALNSKRHAI